MAKGDKQGAAGDLAGAFGESYRTVVQSAVDAQQRNVGLAQNWVESLTGLLESQAETNRALTRAMESYVKVVDESLEAQKKDLADEMKEVMAEAKGRGYDVKILKKIIAIRKRDKDDIAEEEAILELYKEALGM